MYAISLGVKVIKITGLNDDVLMVRRHDPLSGIKLGRS